MSAKVGVLYALEADLKLNCGSIRAMLRHVRAPDANTVYHSLLGSAAELGAEVISHRISQVNEETGEEVVVVKRTLRALPAPKEVAPVKAADRWYELSSFVLKPIEVSTTPCTYKESEHAGTT